MPNHAVDIHHHFLPPNYLDALAKAGLKLLDGGIPVPDWSPEQSLALMDDVGVSKSVISVSSPFVAFLPPDEQVPLSRAINDICAQLKSRRSDRFGGFGLLPSGDLDAALAEAERVLDDLRLDGVALPTNIGGLYLGAPALAPLMSLLNERAAVVFIHPTSPCCFEAFGLAVPAPMIEFPFETVRTVVSLLFSGALQRYPRIRFILPHMGGALPSLAPRIATAGAARLGDRSVPRDVALELMGSFYFDTAGLSQTTQFEGLRPMASMSRIMFGTDFPFTSAERAHRTCSVFDSLELNHLDRAAISHGNAHGLLTHSH